MTSEEETKLPIRGVKVLFLEDEVIVAMMHQEVLESLGCRVTTYTTLTEALDAAASETTFEVAILDVSVHDKLSYPLASILHHRGVGIAFLSGFRSASLEKPWDGFPHCEKPCTDADLEALLHKAIARRRKVSI